MCRKFLIITLLFSIFASSAFPADPELKVNYLFHKMDGTSTAILDDSGNGYTATMLSGAFIKSIEGFNFLHTGADNGYLYLNSEVGKVIGALNDFTISTYIYIAPSANLSGNGNFIWTFSNSYNIANNPAGCMFFSAKETRYAISPTDWRTEKVVGLNTQSAKGEWLHYTYTQKGNVGTIYINGISRAINPNLNMIPSTLGETSYNYLAKSPYASDAYLQNSMYYDFRIYDGALSTDSIVALSSQKELLDTLVYTDLVATALNELQLENTNITQDISLPQSEIQNITISWQSSNTAVISNTGVVQRPTLGADTAYVTLTAQVSCNFISGFKEFDLKVIPFPSDSASVASDLENLQLTGNLDNLREDLELPTTGYEGSAISWSSDQPTYLTDNGIIANRPAKGQGKLKVTLTAIASKGDIAKDKTFEIFLAEDEGFDGYLFAYFTGNYGNQEAIRFALSSDGLHFEALNNNEPVLNSADISRTGGVRDPHILRGEDGNFYMVVTDMVSVLGWDSNRGMVLLKSSDLIHWSSSTIHIPESYPDEFGTVIRVWAPETIFDPVTGKYMVYFSMHKGGSDYDKIYYAYANDSFTDFESAPQLLFDRGSASIDGNIVLKDGIYHLFYKTEANGNGIQKATSANLTGPYTPLNKFLQPTNNAVEGECVFRLINSDTWYMIYDVYTSGYYEFTESTDLENFTVVSGSSLNFEPRHGTVIPLTGEEITRLETNTVVYTGPSTGINDLPHIPSNRIKTQKIVSVDGFYLNSPTEASIGIYNISGIKVKSAELNTGTNFISIPSGIYIIKQTP